MSVHISIYGKGTPLVFFHGWGFDHSIWLPLVEHLKEDYQLILVDLPGFGSSPMQEWDDFKRNLLAQLPPQFHLVGWSLGGLYATRMAIEEPDRTSSLVNVTSSPRFIAEESWPGVPKEIFMGFYERLSFDIEKTVQDFVTLQTNNSTFVFEHSRLPSKEGLITGLSMLDSWDLRSGLKTIKVPTLYLFGRLDPITSVKTMRVMQDLYPDFQYCLFHKAAHMPFMSHRDLFIKELKEFIQ